MMNSHHGIQLPACAAAALLLSSCVVKDGSLDFTWWKDAAAPVMEDDVIIDAGSGQHYHATPAPVRVPDASIPREEASPAPKPAPAPKVASQKQPSVAPPSGTPNTYIVQKGDTLSALARRYGTTVRALVAANGMPDANAPLRIGQTLVIPKAGKSPAPVTTATITTPGLHTVQAGDTLYGIARRYGVAPAALMQINGLTPATANTIRVGTTLRIPAAK